MSVERVLDRELGSVGFYPSPAATQLCDLGSSFLPSWALISPSVEWELGVISKDLSFLHIYPLGTMCVHCPGSS